MNKAYVLDMTNITIKRIHFQFEDYPNLQSNECNNKMSKWYLEDK